MPPPSSDLAVRRHERYACSIPARIAVAETDAAAVRPAKSVGDTDGSAPATLVDCSLGGLGLKTSLFLPVACHIRVTFSTAGRDFTATVRIQRSVMSDRKPTYYIGGASDDGDAATQTALRSALEALKAAGAKPVLEKSGA